MKTKAPKQEANVIRDKWPRVREKKAGGVAGWLIDARRMRKGVVEGETHWRADRAEALALAETIAAEYDQSGAQGVAMPIELRAQAFLAQRIMEPLGRSIVEACEFYRDHLLKQKEKDESALVEVLAEEWHEDKKDPKHKLATPTIKGIRQTANLLKAAFAGRTIKSITEQEADKFIFSLEGDYQRENTRSRCSQFFNWCAKAPRRYVNAADNPFKDIVVILPENDITIFTAKEAQDVITLCENKYKNLVPYMAISLFAGLRPGEAELLTWENVYTEKKLIHVLGSTSKSGVTHNVDIEENLLHWLTEYAPEKAKGPICPQGKTLARRRQELHAELGFKAAGLNPDAEEIEQDITRHSFGSHWQAKYQNVYKLADMMANSPAVIREYYNKARPLSKAEIESYWNIVPKKVAEAMAEKARKEAEAKKAAEEAKRAEEELLGAGQEFGEVDPEDVKAALA